MPTLLQITINSSALHPLHNSTNKISCRSFKFSQPINYPHSKLKIQCFRRDKLKLDASCNKLLFLRLDRGEDGNPVRRGRRAVVVNFSNGGGGDGGGRINSDTARVLGNLALAILLTYLSMSGQLGWLLDAIVSLWLIAVLVPIVGIGAFLWWASRDIVQGSCPNCGNEFQVFKSTLNDELQLCPFCSQPFSVDDDKFVRDPVKFSNESTIFDQAFNSFSTRTRTEKGKDSSNIVVDVEAEIRDAE